jgi:antitoxin component of MazEF toxin-antitoxin module
MVKSKTMTVNRWGAGLGVRLPKEFTDKAGITEKSKVQATIDGDKLLLFAVKESRKHIPLAERRRLFKEQNPDWDSKPYELLPEDKDWLNMPSAGEESAW